MLYFSLRLFLLQMSFILLIADCRLSLWVIIYVSSILGLLHRVNVVLSRRLAEGTEEIHENLSQFSWCPGMNWNLISPQ
jgi:hypothetical protein